MLELIQYKKWIFWDPIYNKMAFPRPPYPKMTFLGTPLYNKMVFESPPPCTKNSIFETPIYNKMAFSRPPYTTKWHFRDPHITSITYFVVLTPPTCTQMARMLTPLYKNGRNLTPSYKKLPKNDFLYKKFQNFDWNLLEKISGTRYMPFNWKSVFVFDLT